MEIALDKEFQVGGYAAQVSAACSGPLCPIPPPDGSVTFSGEMASSSRDLSSGSNSGFSNGAGVNPDLSSVTSLRGQSSLSLQSGSFANLLRRAMTPRSRMSLMHLRVTWDPFNQDSEEDSDDDQSETEI